MIWKGLKELGIGMAVSQSGYVYIVVDYWPAGDFQLEFQFQFEFEDTEKSVEEYTEISEEDQDAEDTAALIEFLEEALYNYNQIRIKNEAKPIVLNEKVFFKLSYQKFHRDCIFTL